MSIERRPQKIANSLQAGIEEGVFEKGVLPTMLEISLVFEAGFPTVREALTILKNKGLTEVKGKGKNKRIHIKY